MQDPLRPMVHRRRRRQPRQSLSSNDDEEAEVRRWTHRLSNLPPSQQPLPESMVHSEGAEDIEQGSEDAGQVSEEQGGRRGRSGDQ